MHKAIARAAGLKASLNMFATGKETIMTERN
jgi:hypothetical protein